MNYTAEKTQKQELKQKTTPHIFPRTTFGEIAEVSQSPINLKSVTERQAIDKSSLSDYPSPPIPYHNSEIASYFSEQVEKIYGFGESTKVQKRPREQICPNMLKKVIVGVCNNCRTTYKKRMFCGKQWCPVCGQKNSVRHTEIINRLMPAYYEMGLLEDENVWGYLTIPMPSELRGIVLNEGFADTFGGSKQNNTLWQFVKKWLKNICGVTLGTKHVHIMGDNSKTGAFHPHLHVIFYIPRKVFVAGLKNHTEGKEKANPAFSFYIDKYGKNACQIKPAYLYALKESLLGFYKEKYPEQTKDLEDPTKIVADFEYKSGLGDKFHVITYSTQARLTTYREDLAGFIYKKCVNRRFGFIHGKEYEKTTQEVWELFHKKMTKDSGKKQEKFEILFPDLLENVCIVCDGKIEWSGIETLEHPVDYYASKDYTVNTGEPPPLQYLGEGVFINVPSPEAILNNIENSKDYMSEKEFKKIRQNMRDKQDLEFFKRKKRKKIKGFL